MFKYIDAEPSKFKVIPIENSDVRGKYILRSKDFISNKIEENGYWELYQVEQCIHHIRPNSTFVDIGANIGTWSVEIGRKLRDKNIQIVAFEPQKEVYNNLCGNMFINGLSDNSQLHRFGLGSPKDMGKKMCMYKINGNMGAARFDNFEVFPNFKKDVEEEVEIRTLDSFNINNISFIKIDVEGFERKVLLGSIETIKKNNYPTIVFECWDEQEFDEERKLVFQLLNEIGYDKIDRVNLGDWIVTKTKKIPTKTPTKITNSDIVNIKHDKTSNKLDDWTLITAIYHFPRYGNDFNKPLDYYLNYGKFVLSLPVNLVIYCDEEEKDFIENARESHGLLDKTKVVVKKLTELSIFS